MANPVRPEAVSAFADSFIGHLPGYAAECQTAGTDPPEEATYNRYLAKRWHELLDSPDSQDERLLHTFLERHPTLLPGSAGVDGDSGHFPFPVAVITKPKLPGLSDREPDFMWIATDSANLYPVLIEIETPHKRWFYGDRAEIHSDFTHAQGQLAEWRAWFNKGINRSAFLDYYEVPDLLRRRQLAPRYVLIYGRRDDYEVSTRRLEKRAQLAREDERLMSFDRLTPAKHGPALACVIKRQDGYRAVSVPPSWTIVNDGEDYLPVSGWDNALDVAADMSEARREYLKAELSQLLADPHRHYQAGRGEIRFRQSRWL